MDVFIFLIGCYFLGQFMTGYLVSRFLYQRDIRTEGSGNVGARNALRLYGKTAFIITALGDGLKAFIAVIFADYFFHERWVEMLALFFVCLGHIYPLVLRGKGGKGIASYIGGLIYISFPTLLIYLGLLSFFFLLAKSLTIATSLSFVILPFFYFLLTKDLLASSIFLLISLLIIYKHKDDLLKRLKYRSGV